MFGKFRNRLQLYPKVAGVELYIGQDGNMEGYVTILKYSKSILSTIFTSAEPIPADKFTEIIHKSTPVSLIISGKGIIFKELSPEGLDDQQILNQILPKVSIHDYYLQKAGATDGKQIITVIRKSLITQILQKFGEMGLKIIQLGLGPFAIRQFMFIYGAETQQALQQVSLPHAGVMLSFRGSELQQALSIPIDTKIQATYKIGNEVLSSKQLPSYAAADQILFGNQTGLDISIPSSRILFNREEYENEQLFRKAGMGVLAFFLVLLLVNFLFFDYYDRQKSELTHKNKFFQSQLDQTNYTKAKVEERKRFIENSGWGNPSMVSFYSDRLTRSMPTTLTLVSMEINPVNKKYEDGKNNLSFDFNTIIVHGTCLNPRDINEWQKSLSSSEWVKSVELLNFMQDKEEKVNKFILSIKY